MSNEQPTPKIGQVRAEYLSPDRFQIVLDSKAYMHLLATLEIARRAAKDDHDLQCLSDINAWSQALAPAAYEAIEAEEEEEYNQRMKAEGSADA